MSKAKALFFHAGCPVCVSAEQQFVQVLDPERYSVDVVHPGRQKDRIAEAEAEGYGIKSVPALLAGGHRSLLSSALRWPIRTKELAIKRLLAALAVAAFAQPVLAAEPEVPYPAGYRDWHHVKSMVIAQGHPLFDAFGGIHHLYANPKAIAGYKAGKFPDGSVIVFDLLEAKSADNAVTEGARKVVGVMHKNAKKYAATGGWGFEGFGGGDKNNRVVRSNAASACFACHAPQKEHDYVFSRLRD